MKEEEVGGGRKERGKRAKSVPFRKRRKDCDVLSDGVELQCTCWRVFRHREPEGREVNVDRGRQRLDRVKDVVPSEVRLFESRQAEQGCVVKEEG